MNADFDEVLADPGTHRLFNLRLGLLRRTKLSLITSASILKGFLVVSVAESCCSS